MRQRHNYNRVFLTHCIELAQKHPGWSTPQVEREAENLMVPPLPWQPVDEDRGSFKFYRQIEIDGRYFWAQAVRYGRQQKFVVGWDVTELRAPGGFLKGWVGKALLWRNVDSAVKNHLEAPCTPEKS